MSLLVLRLRSPLIDLRDRPLRLLLYLVTCDREGDKEVLLFLILFRDGDP